MPTNSALVRLDRWSRQNLIENPIQLRNPPNRRGAAYLVVGSSTQAFVFVTMSHSRLVVCTCSANKGWPFVSSAVSIRTSDIQSDYELFRLVIAGVFEISAKRSRDLEEIRKISLATAQKLLASHKNKLFSNRGKNSLVEYVQSLDIEIVDPSTNEGLAEVIDEVFANEFSSIEDVHGTSNETLPLIESDVYGELTDSAISDEFVSEIKHNEKLTNDLRDALNHFFEQHHVPLELSSSSPEGAGLGVFFSVTMPLDLKFEFFQFNKTWHYSLKQLGLEPTSLEKGLLISDYQVAFLIAQISGTLGYWVDQQRRQAGIDMIENFETLLVKPLLKMCDEERNNDDEIFASIADSTFFALSALCD